MLSEKTLAIIRTITPVVAQHAEEITQRFYKIMFRENPEVRAYFNPAHQFSGGQQSALAGAICAYFVNIDNPAVLGPAINLIAHKHCSLGIQPEHYPIVGKHLLTAIGEVLGDAVTPEIVDAVTEAYGFLADVLIKHEKGLYAEQLQAQGGWNGYREFYVDRKVSESAEVSSLYLKPVDGRPIANFEAGQYLTVKIQSAEGQVSLRNYSISGGSQGESYRISVKREAALRPGQPNGVVSNHLHDATSVGDRVWIAPPSGEFTLQTPDLENQRPIVLLAGGVGATPLIAMAHQLVQSGHTGPVTFIHASRNSAVQIFRDEIRELKTCNNQFKYLSLLNEPTEQDLLAGDYDHVGYLTRELIEKETAVETASYYFCGPAAFMKSVFKTLTDLGVDDSRIKFEFFGPRQDITKLELSHA